MKTIVIIPSRLAATRLPGKPLLKINGLSIISHVVKKAVEANLGEVFVAAEDQEIIDDVIKNGGQGILTSKTHKTGTDRIYEAIKKLGKKDVELVVNLQGDEPLINIDDIKYLYNNMIKYKSLLGTLGSNIEDVKLHNENNVVKVITQEKLDDKQFPEAKNFLRKSNYEDKNTYHHIGIYCYRLDTLEKFVYLKQSEMEIKHRLEQLRALENDIKINVALAKTSPIGVDTEEDLIAIKKIMEYKH